MSNLELKIAEKLEYFKTRKDSLPDMRLRYAELQEKFKTMDMKDGIKLYKDVQNEIEHLKKDIHDIHHGISETEYLMTLGTFMRDVYNDEEDKQKEQKKIKGAFSDIVTVAKSSKKGKHYNRYMEVVEGEHRTYHSDDECFSHEDYMCKECGGDMVIDRVESTLVCEQCGLSEQFMAGDVTNLTYEQEINVNVVSFFMYERINHFAEWLSQIQGSESTDIPENVMNDLKVELKKNGITKTSQIKPAKIKEYLKKLKHSKYYEHTMYITNLLSGKPGLKFSEELEQKLRLMFKEIQEPFQRHCPAHRTNFLSYAYTIYKLCELLDKDEYLEYFPLLKSAEKVHQHDVIWEKICRDLGWAYYPSSNF